MSTVTYLFWFTILLIWTLSFIYFFFFGWFWLKAYQFVFFFNLLKGLAFNFINLFYCLLFAILLIPTLIFISLIKRACEKVMAMRCRKRILSFIAMLLWTVGFVLLSLWFTYVFCCLLGCHLYERNFFVRCVRSLALEIFWIVEWSVFFWIKKLSQS